MSAPLREHELASVSSSGHTDGLGRRVLTFDRETGTLLERLHLRPELAAFQAAIAQRVAALAPLNDTHFATTGVAERDARTGELTVLSEFVSGTRLSDLLDIARDSGLVPGVDVALGYLLDALEGLAALHESCGVAHGLIDPSRTLLAPDGLVVFLDPVYGAVVERLGMSSRRLWTSLRLAAPPDARAIVLDAASDVTQAALSAVMLVLGRPLEDEDYPDAFAGLLAEVIEVAQIRASAGFSTGLQRLLQRSLPLPGRRPYRTAVEALEDLRELLTRDIGAETCRRALLDFLDRTTATGDVDGDDAPESTSPVAATLPRDHDMTSADILDDEAVAEEDDLPTAWMSSSVTSDADTELVAGARTWSDEAPAPGTTEDEHAVAGAAEDTMYEGDHLSSEDAAELDEDGFDEDPDTHDDSEALEFELALDPVGPSRGRTTPARGGDPEPVYELSSRDLDAEILKTLGIGALTVPARPVPKPFVLPPDPPPAPPADSVTGAGEPLASADASVEAPAGDPKADAEVLPAEPLPASTATIADTTLGAGDDTTPASAPSLPAATAEGTTSPATVREDGAATARTSGPAPQGPESSRRRKGQEKKSARARKDRLRSTVPAPAPLRTSGATPPPGGFVLETTSRDAAPVTPRETVPERAPEPPSPSVPAALTTSAASLTAIPLKPPTATSTPAPIPPVPVPPAPLPPTVPSAVAGPRPGWLVPPDKAAAFEIPAEAIAAAMGGALSPAAPSPVRPVPVPVAAYPPPPPMPTQPMFGGSGGAKTGGGLNARPSSGGTTRGAAANDAVTRLTPVRIKAEPPEGFSPPRRTSPEPFVVDGAGLPPAETLRGPHFGTRDEPPAFPLKLAIAAVVILAGGIFGARTWQSAHQTPEAAPDPVLEAAAAPPTPVLPAAPKSGIIVADTRPAGAKVLLDGQPVGETPLRLESVAPGRHTITFDSPSGVVRRSIRVASGETVTLDVPVFSGWLAVYAPITLNVYDGEKSLGTTNDGRLMLSPGTHTLTFSNVPLGYRLQQEVQIAAGDTTTLRLEPTGEANVNAVPWAEVWMAGRKLGDTPLGRIPLPLGTNELIFKHPKLGERRVSVLIRANQSTPVSVDFGRGK